MPLPKKSKSIIGLKLSSDIYDFMEANAKYLNKDGSTIEEGNRAIAEAIAFGVSKALSDPQVLSLTAPMDSPLPVSTAVAAGIAVLAPPPSGVGATTTPGVGTGAATSIIGTQLKTILNLFKE